MLEAGSDDGAAAPITAPTSAMSADEQWGLGDVAMPQWAHNRDSILEHLKGKLAKGSPLKYLETKYPTPDSKADYARILWQMLPPLNDDCLFWDFEEFARQEPDHCDGAGLCTLST